MEENNTPNDATVESGSFSMNKFIDACKAKWQWFALSATIFTCLGVWVAITQEPEYKRTMSVLIKDPQNAPNISEMIGSISAFGFSGAKKNVYNELLTITSPDVMTDVVRRLHLETAYTLKGFRTEQPFTARHCHFRSNSSTFPQTKELHSKLMYAPMEK